MRRKIFMQCFTLAILPAWGSFAFAQSNEQKIMTDNTPAIVYIQVRNADGKISDSGTGFIVSSDGYVVTVAHLKADKELNTGQTVTAVIGARSGTALPLTLIEVFESTDVALWKLPQSPSCRHSVMLTTKTVSASDDVITLGFPDDEGLTPSFFKISNLTSTHGFYKADGFLQPGDSGAPVFNKQGQVIAIVEGGTAPGTRYDDLIPIGRAISLIKNWDVKAGIDGPTPCWNPPKPNPTPPASPSLDGGRFDTGNETSHPKNVDWLVRRWHATVAKDLSYDGSFSTMETRTCTSHWSESFVMDIETVDPSKAENILRSSRPEIFESCDVTYHDPEEPTKSSTKVLIRGTNNDKYFRVELLGTNLRMNFSDGKCTDQTCWNITKISPTSFTATSALGSDISFGSPVSGVRAQITPVRELHFTKY
jgi:hypothetical protein